MARASGDEGEEHRWGDPREVAEAEDRQSSSDGMDDGWRRPEAPPSPGSSHMDLSPEEEVAGARRRGAEDLEDMAEEAASIPEGEPEGPSVEVPSLEGRGSAFRRQLETACNEALGFDDAMGYLPPRLHREVVGQGWGRPTLLATMRNSGIEDVQQLVGELLGSTREPTDEEVVAMMKLIVVADQSALEIRTKVARIEPEEFMCMRGKSDRAQPSIPLHEVDRKPPTGKAGPVARWATRRTRLKSRAGSAGAGSGTMDEVEAKAREKQVKILVGILTEMKAPSVSSGGGDPARVAKGRRSATLRERTRTWLHARKWFLLEYGIPYPADVCHILHYLRDKFDGHCPRTFFESFRNALRFVEAAAELDESRRLSNHPAIQNSLEEYSLRVSNSTPLADRERRHARRLVVAVLLSMELCVVNPDNKDYNRGWAWYRLACTWGSARSDDGSWAALSSLQWGKRGMRCKLMKTKTTGPGKKTSILHWYVSADAWLNDPSWCQVGLAIWFRLNPERKVFAGLPNLENTAMLDHAATYADASSNTRALLSVLQVPQPRELSQGGRPTDEEGRYAWDCADLPLLPEKDMLGYWTLHSARNWLPSMAALLGYSRDDTDRLGRWHADGSEVYILTQRRLVEKIQGEVAHQLRHNFAWADIFDEEEVIEDIRTFLRADSDLGGPEIPEERLRVQLANLTLFDKKIKESAAPPRVGGTATPTGDSKTEVSDQEGEIRGAPIEVEADEAAPGAEGEVPDPQGGSGSGGIEVKAELAKPEGGVAEVPHAGTQVPAGTRSGDATPAALLYTQPQDPGWADDEDLPGLTGSAALRQTGYYVFQTKRRGHKCLHHVGRCWRIPGTDLPWERITVYGADRPPAEAYHHACAQCWKSGLSGAGGATPPARPQGDASVATSEESSSSESPVE